MTSARERREIRALIVKQKIALKTAPIAQRDARLVFIQSLERQAEAD